MLAYILNHLKSTEYSLYLSKGPEVFFDDFLGGIRVKASNKDFLYWLLLHGHGSLGVNLSAI